MFRAVRLEHFRVWEVWPAAGNMQKILIRLPNQDLCDWIKGPWNVAKLHANGRMIGAELPHQAYVGFYREEALISS